MLVGWGSRSGSWGALTASQVLTKFTFYFLFNFFNSEEIFLCYCPNREKATLQALILQYVKPGTHIITDGWGSYSGLDKIGYAVTLSIISHVSIWQIYDFSTLSSTTPSTLLTQETVAYIRKVTLQHYASQFLFVSVVEVTAPIQVMRLS